MRDTPKGTPPDPRMTLLAVNQTYWLYEGAEFLNAMLRGQGYFPVPVQCYVFEDVFELRLFIGEDRVLTDFWGINPDIVARLRRDGHLVEQSAPDE